MRAVVCTHGALEVTDLPDPTPARGQLVLAVQRCGICGSDLHARHHADELDAVLRDVGYDGSIRSDTPVVMGHEFVGEVVERGRGAGRGMKVGTSVVTFPIRRAQGAVHLTGLSPFAGGGYAEQVLVEASMSLPVPNGLAPELAALTEPMAVALHAVRRSEVSKRDVAVVLGCGPVGLAVICHLKARGVRTVVASDLSSGRRELARRCGADIVVDPRTDSPYDAVPTAGWKRGAPEVLELAVSSMEKLRRLPGWQHVFRAAEAVGAVDFTAPVIFECVGVPGMIDGILSAAPVRSRVVVVGVCMGDDRIRPSMGINKEIDLRFVLCYTPLELRDALHALAEGTVDGRPLVTGVVGLDGVAAAFDALGDPEAHAKIMIDPRSTATSPQPLHL